MEYICLECEKIFEENEIAEVNGEEGCPYCNGDFVDYETYLKEWK